MSARHKRPAQARNQLHGALRAVVQAAWLGAALAAMGQAQAQAQTPGLPALSQDNARLANAGPLDQARFGAALAQVASIEVSTDRDGVPANGRDAIVLTIRVLDRNGNPVAGDVPLRLQATRGRFVGMDARDALGAVVDREFALPGNQVLARDGVLKIQLQAPSEPGETQVRVSAGARQMTLALSFVPDLRELIAVGMAEGVINLSRSSGNLVLPTRPSDGFEQELRRWQREFADGQGAAGARLAFFLKGRISGQSLLTAAYDSDKEVRERLFREVQPEAFYPVYGDASVAGFDAQSSSRLYVRLDQGKNFLLWGDFSTAQASADDAGDAVQLGRYARALTGAQGRWAFGGERDDAAVLRAFASRDNLRQVVDELPARGISGPYALRYANGVVGSERVELVVRDRNAPGVVLSLTPLVRFVDYDFEPFSGRLLFKAPVPSLDAALNPVSIRALYEVEDGGPRYWVYGADLRVKLAEPLSVGGSFARDDNPLARYQLASANARLRLGRTVLTTEYAQSQGEAVTNFGFTPTLAAGPVAITAAAQEGQAARFELRHDGAQLQGRVFGQRTSAGFYNPAAGASLGVGSARSEAGAKLSYALTEGLRLTGELLHNQNHATGGTRQGAFAGLAWDITRYLTAEVGLRHAQQSGAGATLPATGAAGLLPGTAVSPVTGGALLDPTAVVSTGNQPYRSDSVKARVTLRPTASSSVFVEGEQGLADGSGAEPGQAVAVGGEVRVSDVGRLYGRSERASGLGGDYGLAGQGAAAASTSRQTATVIGIDAQVVADGQLFSEYRLRDGLSGRDAVAAMGLRNAWRLGEGWRLNTALERVQVLDGNAQQGRAVALGLDQVGSALWKGSTRLEWRQDDAAGAAPASTSWLHSLALARKLDADWTLLGRNLHLRRDATGHSADSVDNRFQIGAAWRQTQTNVWSALGRYEHIARRDGATGDDSGRHIVSADATFHPSRPWWFTGKAAAKWVDARLGCAVDPVTGTRSGCAEAQTQAQLLQLRALYDISPRWDVGLMASVLGEDGLRNRRWAYGAEVGYLLVENLWLSVGYNHKGIVDADLATDYTGQGLYTKLRLKFDEKLLARGLQLLDRTVTPEAKR